MFARRRFEVGGRKDGDVFNARERPVGVVREGGRNEGDSDSPPPLNAISLDFDRLTCANVSFSAALRGLATGQKTSFSS
jgi:hypothetical protein